MIELDETELKLKEDIDIIFNGGYDNKFPPDQIEYIKRSEEHTSELQSH